MCRAGSFAVLDGGGDLSPRGVRTGQPSGVLQGNGTTANSGSLWNRTRAVINAPVPAAALLHGIAQGGCPHHCDNGTAAVILDDGVVRAGTMFAAVFLTASGWRHLFQDRPFLDGNHPRSGSG